MVDAAIIKKTQESLGTVITKPPLTEKLLSKPPFRYLHDIISEVTKATGFLEGLYEENEKSSSAIKDKEGKMLYLQKAIDAVGIAIGSQLSVRPSKIIAGQEAEKTNEFLQYLGRCAGKGADNDVVKRVKKGDKPSKKSETSKDGSKAKKDTSKSKSKERDSSKGRGRREQSSSKERVSGSSKERATKERPERGRRERKDEKRDPSKEKSDKIKKENEHKREKEERKENEEKHDKEERREKEERKRRKEAEEEAAASGPQLPVPQHDQENENDADEEKPLTNGFHDAEETGPVRIPRPSSAKGARRRPEPTNETAEHKQTYAEAVVGASQPPVPIIPGKRRERPTSARPAPPRIKKKDREEPEDINARDGSGAAPAGIIIAANQSDDDEDMFVKEEAEDSLLTVKQPVIMNRTGQHGGLVQKIIESQKQYAGAEQVDDKGPIMNQAARQKERNLVKKEIDQLRCGIQTLASSAAPLGKVLDYLQEDLDSMQKELENWRSENRYHDTAIKAEESHMEKTLEPLKDQLEETEQRIIDQINKINTMKCNIHNNDLKIEQMLSTMSFSAS